MKLDKSTLKKIENFAREKVKNFDFAHNWTHMERTVKLARYISSKEKANQDICTVAAYLHDIGYSIEYKNHNITGAKMAGVFLKKLKLNDDFIEKVQFCILCHSTSYLLKQTKPVSIEVEVVYDSDMLQCLGPFGVIRVLTSYMHSENKTFKEAYKLAKKIEYNTFNKILQTKTAKKMIKNDYQYMQKFYKIHDKWDKLAGLKNETCHYFRQPR